MKNYLVPAKGATCKSICCTCGADCSSIGFCEICPKVTEIKHVWSNYETKVVATGLAAIGEKDAFNKEMDV
jgi:hypothetical protein